MTDSATVQGDGRIEIGHLAKDVSFVTRVLRAQLRVHNAAVYTNHEMASGGVAILCLIGLNPGISQKDLAGAVVLKKSAVTKIIGEMEQNGLVVRSRGDGDRRFNSLRLTRKGAARRAAMLKDIAAQQDQLLAGLEPTERREFFRLMWRLIDRLEQQGAHTP